MKSASLLLALLCSSALAFAQESFPGLRSVMTEQEWKHAGLDQLSADQIGVINAALARYRSGVTQQPQTQPTITQLSQPQFISERKESPSAAPAAAPAPENKRTLAQSSAAPVLEEKAPAKPTPAPAPVVEKKRSWLERFGLPIGRDDDWKTIPPLKAKVLAWEGGNRFRLDNGQIWEGSEAIPFDLVDKEIEIYARPNHQFTFSFEGKNTTLRIHRLR